MLIIKIDRDNSVTESAKRTLSIVKTALKNYDFAVTGSYAKLSVSHLSEFNRASDLDIAVADQDVGGALESLLKTPQLIDGDKIEGKNQYIILGVLTTPIHLIGTLKPKQEKITIGDVTYILPVEVLNYGDGTITGYV